MALKKNYYEIVTGIEAADIIKMMGWWKDFCRGNIIKYLIRAGRKEGESELAALRKAQWYLGSLIDTLEREVKENE